MSDTKKSAQQRADLRTCASCEWIFHLVDSDEHGGCPKCGFATYGARFVYGAKAYRYAKTQEPWFNKQLSPVIHKLHSEIRETLAKSKHKPRGVRYAFQQSL